MQLITNKGTIIDVVTNNERLLKVELHVPELKSVSGKAFKLLIEVEDSLLASNREIRYSIVNTSKDLLRIESITIDVAGFMETIKPNINWLLRLVDGLDKRFEFKKAKAIQLNLEIIARHIMQNRNDIITAGLPKVYNRIVTGEVNA